MFKLIGYLKGKTAAVVAAPLCKLIEAIAELFVPMIVATVIDTGIAGGDKSYVVKYCIVIAALAVGGFIISVIGQFLASKAALFFGTRVRAATFKRINALPAATHDRIGGASLVTRLTADTVYCQNTVNMTLRLALRSPFVIIGSFVMSIIIDPVLAMIFLVMTAVLGCIVACVLKISLPRIKRAQKTLDETARLSAQSLSGARVIRAFSKQENAKAEFGKAADNAARTNISAARLAALLTPLTFAAVNLAIIATLWLGGIKVDGGRLSQGNLVALINYLMQAFFAIVAIGNVFNIFTRASACAARINEILDAPLPEDGTDENVDVDAREVVRFENVSFAYDGDYDVRNISFTLEKDCTLGIIGGTGSGKSTLVNLIERFYSPDVGDIYFCGKPAKSYRADKMRAHIGYVPQRAAVIEGSLDKNLKIANPDATKDREETALCLAQASELLSERGLDGYVSAGGKNLSGGQRQRVNIARALCRDNVLYLFDDATSALDYKTERAFIDAMKGVSGAKIFVSQRISAVSCCDKILVLDGGEIVGCGTHDELKKTCPLYAEFCASQEGS